MVLLSFIASAQEISVYIDGKKLFFDVPPTKVEERTMVPLRAIFEGLGAFVEYDTPSRTIKATKGNIKVQLTLDSPVAYVNDQLRTLDVPAMSLSGRTMVPLRFVGEAFGAKVKWDGSTQSIFIETQDMPVMITTPAPAAEDSAIIYMISHDAIKSLHPGDVVTITLVGTPGGKASFDITGIVNGIPMSEITTGKYEGNYTIKSSDKGKDLVVIGYLVKGNTNPSVLQADKKLSLGEATEAVSIYSVLHNAVEKQLYPGDVLEVTLMGSSGGKATFDIGNIITNISMNETQNGTYKGVYTVRSSDNISNAIITGYLVKDTVSAAPFQCQNPLTMGASVVPAEDVKITSFTHSAKGNLKKGDDLTVVLKGTPGGKAYFDITNFKSSLPMTEIQSGVYQGTYRILAGDNVSDSYLLGHLSKAGKEAPIFQTGPITIAGIVPKIASVSPADGSKVETDRPNIYVSFDTQNGTSINPQTAKLIVNGVDVTSRISKAPMFIGYNPTEPLPLKTNIWVELSAQDSYGNTINYGWTFMIVPATTTLISSAYHNGQFPLKAGEKLQVIMYGVTGGQAWFDINGFKNNIAMTEVSQGRYVGEYTVTPQDKVSGLKVIAYLRNQSREDNLVLDPAITFDVEQGFNAPQLINIQDGQQVNFPLTVEGYTKAYATVEIKYEYAAPLLGPLVTSGVAGTKRVSADGKGYFVDTYTSIFGAGTKHTITVKAIDNATDKTSPPTVITVTQK